MTEINGIYYETEEDYYMILDELYRDEKEVNLNANKIYVRVLAECKRWLS